MRAYQHQECPICHKTMDHGLICSDCMRNIRQKGEAAKDRCCSYWDYFACKAKEFAHQAHDRLGIRQH